MKEIIYYSDENIRSLYDELDEELNSDNNLKIAKQLIKLFGIKKDKPFLKKIEIKRIKEYRLTFFLKRKIYSLIDFYGLRIELNRQNYIEIDKIYADETDYGFSSYGCIEDGSNKYHNVVHIKLNELKKIKRVSREN